MARQIIIPGLGLVEADLGFGLLFTGGIGYFPTNLPAVTGTGTATSGEGSAGGTGTVNFTGTGTGTTGGGAVSGTGGEGIGGTGGGVTGAGTGTGTGGVGIGGTGSGSTDGGAVTGTGGVGVDGSGSGTTGGGSASGTDGGGSGEVSGTGSAATGGGSVSADGGQGISGTGTVTTGSGTATGYENTPIVVDPFVMQVIMRITTTLSEVGENIIIRRYVNGAPTDIATRGMIGPLSAADVVKGHNGKELSAKAIVSPSGLESLLPLRAGDKIVRGGLERHVEYVDNKQIGPTIVRITLYFTG